jgi:hypothetical protein
VSGGLEDHELAARRGRWSTAEARIYPLAMVSVAAYQQALEAVSRLLDHLRAEVHDQVALVAYAADPTAARTLLDTVSLEAVGLHVDDLVGAACASRDRELSQAEDQQRRVDAVGRAMSAGDEWADVAFRRPFGLQGTVPELRIHLPSRRGVRAMLEADADTGAPRLRVVPVHVDFVTGDLAVIQEHEDLDLLVDDRTGWERAVAWFAGEWGAEVDARRHP